MENRIRPTKEQVRAWLAERRQAGQPPPNCEQIRRRMGWWRGDEADRQCSEATPATDGACALAASFTR